MIIHKGGAPASVRATASGVDIAFVKRFVWAVRFIDVYRFENGKWKFVRTDKFTRAGVYAHAFDPAFVNDAKLGRLASGRAFGYSDGGYKFDTQWEAN